MEKRSLWGKKKRMVDMQSSISEKRKKVGRGKKDAGPDDTIHRFFNCNQFRRPEGKTGGKGEGEEADELPAHAFAPLEG